MSRRVWKNLAYGFVLFLILANILVFQFLKAYVADRGEGNLRLSLRGLYVKSWIYEKNEQTVMLIGMTHIADERFFRAIVDSIPTKDSIVLLEGVADSDRVSGQALNYSVLARWLGTSYQDKSFDADIKREHTYLYADVDSRDLSPESKRFLELLGEEDNWRKKMEAAWNDDFDEEEWDRAEKSFQTERNLTLMAHFDRIAPDFRTIAIPWGATHIDDFARQLEERGYTRVETQENRAISFGW